MVTKRINGTRPCLYNGQLIDDELNYQLAKFAEGVRVLVFSDNRNMPNDIGMRVYRANKTFYDKILKYKSLADAEDYVKASVLLISGCKDNQRSLNGDANGLFTSQLLYVWNQGDCDKNYRQFYKEIYNLMPPNQQPNYYRTGKKIQSSKSKKSLGSD
jgi:hypothetical protein